IGDLTPEEKKALDDMALSESERGEKVRILLEYKKKYRTKLWKMVQEKDAPRTDAPAGGDGKGKTSAKGRGRKK
ncbi:hypothetical protein KKA13_02655, partial [Patescibacteria group bacterium]|nr:hypothetical protein [Patescibacteria group bacterium]MBU1613169.1 hypothetical protein [Patescibacteria group bacterium]